VALGLSALALLVLGASPFEAGEALVTGAVGSPAKLGYVLTAWVPLCLCAAGLLVTFAAGLWNIGVEGQVVLGAVFATGVMRLLQNAAPPVVVWLAAGLAALLGGALWAILAGALKRWGGVHEIFGGLGLNFVAGSLALYLVMGPWQRPGSASTGGTEAFPPELWLPAWSGWNVSGVELFLGLLALVLVAVLLRGSAFGLRLKAIGLNWYAAYLRGVSTERHLLLAFALCGGLAGLAGFVRVAGASAGHNLVPEISSGYGYLGILVVLLADMSLAWCVPISVFFAAILMGSVGLSYLGLDSSLGQVFQGLLVLGVLMARGVQAHARR